MSALSMNFSDYAALTDEKKVERMDVSDVTARMDVMRMQESTIYQQQDYLSKPNSSSNSSSSAANSVDEECRVKMCDWCYEVAEFCNFRRSTVAIGISFLDRFLCTTSERAQRALSNRKEFQLAAMTALYTAIKLHEPLVMDVGLLSDLSRGCYTGADFESMESEMLSALRWRVHGPTPLDFVQHFLALLPDSISPIVDTVLLDFAQYQTELTVADYSFISIPSSMIGLASIINAMEGIGQEFMSSDNRQIFQKAIVQVMGIENVTSKLFKDVRVALMQNFAFHSEGHDLRHCAASAVACAAEDDQVMEEQMNESNDGMENMGDRIDGAMSSSFVPTRCSDDALSPVCVAEQLIAETEQTEEKRPLVIQTPQTPNHQVITIF